MKYEELLMICEAEGLIVKEKPLRTYDGRIKGNRIAIRKTIPYINKKAFVLSEELGHYFTTAGDILNQEIAINRKQELRARAWCYNEQIGLFGIIRAFNAGCESRYEIAEFLDVPEEGLQEAIEYYKSKYGDNWVQCGDYLIRFVPELIVYKKFN